MHYREFETAFKAQLQTHKGSYPHAVAYHLARFEQTIEYLLTSILKQTKVVDFETKEFQRQAGSFVNTFALSTKP